MTLLNPVVPPELVEEIESIETAPSIIDLDTVKAQVWEIIQEVGEDYRYPESEKENGMCRYLKADGTGSCIVGRYIERHLPALFSRLQKYEGVAADLVFHDLESTQEARRFLLYLQKAQDAGLPWGFAFQRASA